MKRVSLFLTIVLLSVVFVSCGGETTATLSNGDSADTEAARDIRVSLPQCDTGGVITGSTISDIETLNVKVLDSLGEKQWSKSYASDQIENGMEISGIPDVVGGQLVVMGFAKGDNNTPKWLGKVTNITFKKGVETKATLLLYPIDGSLTCLPSKMTIGRFGHTATMLPDGRVLLAGGFVSSSDSGGHKIWNATDTVEILDIETGTTELLDVKLAQPRAMHSAFALPDGSVVLVGGVRKMGLVGTTVTGYPSLPVTYEIPVTSVERFTPPYPKYNLLINGVGTPTPAKTTNLVLDDPHFMTYQSYDVVQIDQNNFRVYISGGLKEDGVTPSGVVAVLTVTYVSTDNVTATLTDFGTGDASLLPLMGADANSMLSIGGRAFGASANGQKISQTTTPWGVSLANSMGASQVRTQNGSYSFGGIELSCTDAATCTAKDSKKVYELFPTAAGERAGALALSTSYSDIAYIPAFERFIIIGGTISLFNAVSNPLDNTQTLQPGDAHTIMLRASVATLNGSGGASDTWHKELRNPHLLSKTIVYNDSTLFVTGGVTGLGDGGESITDIEIMTIQK